MEGKAVITLTVLHDNINNYTFNTTHILLLLLLLILLNTSKETSKESLLDKGEVFGALMTGLSKTFDCLNHEFLITKLNACGFTLLALKLFHYYLSNKKQRTKINSSYSEWLEIVFGVPWTLII